MGDGEVKNTTIIGGGLSGLTAYHMLDGIVLESGYKTDSIMDQDGPFYFHYDEPTVRFLNSMKVPFNTETKTVGIYLGKKVMSVGELTADEKKLAIEQYTLKTRKALPEELSEGQSIMNFGKPEFTTIAVDLHVFWKKMLDAERLLGSTVTALELQSHMLKVSGQQNWRMYQRAISTIALPAMARCINYEINLPCTTRLFYQIEGSEHIIKDFAFVYFPESHFIFHRMSEDTVELSVVDANKVSVNALEQELNSIGVRLTSTIPKIRPNGHFMKTEDDPKQLIQKLREYDVYCVGRFAEWDHSVKFGSVVKKLEEIRDGA